MKNRAAHSGFTLVESIMATVLVAVLLVAAISATDSSATLQYKAAERAQGRFLADGLINDITQLAYEEPTTTPAFGIETGESSSSKVNYDDVDDFNGWTESPPQQRDGTVMSNFSNWSRSVLVERVSSTNLTGSIAAETGIKRITVTVKHNGNVVCTAMAYKMKVP